jgi:hypothetical protein
VFFVCLLVSSCDSIGVLCGRTGVDGAVVDADHAEVHQRHRQTDGQGRQGLFTRRGEEEGLERRKGGQRGRRNAPDIVVRGQEDSGPQDLCAHGWVC